jgi:hypothetical protein
VSAHCLSVCLAEPCFDVAQISRVLPDGSEKTIRSTSQLERFFREANKMFSGGPVSAVTADEALTDACFQHNVSMPWLFFDGFPQIANLIPWTLIRCAALPRTGTSSTARTTCGCSLRQQWQHL